MAASDVEEVRLLRALLAHARALGVAPRDQIVVLHVPLPRGPDALGTSALEVSCVEVVRRSGARGHAVWRGAYSGAAKEAARREALALFRVPGVVGSPPLRDGDWLLHADCDEFVSFDSFDAARAAQHLALRRVLADATRRGHNAVLGRGRRLVYSRAFQQSADAPERVTTRVSQWSWRRLLSTTTTTTTTTLTTLRIRRTARCLWRLFRIPARCIALARFSKSSVGIVDMVSWRQVSGPTASRSTDLC